MNEQSLLFGYQPNISFSAGSDDGGEKNFRIVYRCDGVKTDVNLLRNILPEFEIAGVQQNGDTSVNISLGFSEDKSAAIKIEGKVLGLLYQAAFPKQQVKVKLTMKRFHFGFTFSDSKWQDEYFPFVSTSTKEMDICTSAETPFCIDANFALPRSVKEEWYNFVDWKRFSGNYNLNLLIFVKFSVLGEKHSQTQVDIYRKMLHDAILTDLIIVTGDGKEVSCHRGILGANSPVLKTMLENKLKESNTGRIEMPDMSEKGAKVFLEYLYYREISAAVKDSSVALELFQAGEKYDMNDLKDAMKTIFLLNHQSSWWTVDVTVRLFLFSNKILETDSSGASQLKQKSIKILKRNYGDWKGSEFFKNFLKDEPQALAELFDGVLTFV